MSGGREGRREERNGGREGGKEGGKERGKKGGREGVKEERREGKKEGGRREIWEWREGGNYIIATCDACCKYGKGSSSFLVRTFFSVSKS